MSPETNKAIIRRMIEQVWHKRQVDLVEEFFTEDHVGHSAGATLLSGLEELKTAIVMALNVLSDSKLSINDEIAEGNKVVYRWTMASTIPGELNSITSAGNEVFQSGVTIFHLSKARVDEFWLLTDNPEFMRQLGIISSDSV